jgi:hypothetical protein
LAVGSAERLKGEGEAVGGLRVAVRRRGFKVRRAVD